jgi:hypothetical protein
MQLTVFSHAGIFILNNWVLFLLVLPSLYKKEGGTAQNKGVIAGN